MTYLLYDLNADALMAHTRRTQLDREAHILPVVVPTWDDDGDGAVENECMFCTEPADLCEHWRFNA